MQIEDLEFSGFPGRDATNLRQLGYEGRLAWFRFRLRLVFLTPLLSLLQSESADCYIWLCVMTLAGSAISALADFASRGADSEKFCHFLNTYLPAFQQAAFALEDPTWNTRGQAARTPAQQFYKFFRNGLAHDFCIGWGGIQHRQELEGNFPTYIFQTRQGPNDEHGLGIIPREFIADFQNGCERFISDLVNAPPGDPLRVTFNRTFERVYLQKLRPPLP
jgi:hypothetical protein